MKHIEREVAAALEHILTDIPFVTVHSVGLSERFQNYEIDALLEVEIEGKPYKIVLEVKSSGQPKPIRAAIEQVARSALHIGGNPIRVVGAPFITEAARLLCIDEGVGYVDLAGNCRIVEPNIYISHHGGAKPKAAQRELKSIFAPKSAQILRVLLRHADRAWKVTDLAEAAEVSVGQVSNVRKALVEREWADVEPDGLRLTNRDALLRDWRAHYTPPIGERQSFYTALHGKMLETALADALAEANRAGRAAAASFTAADWLAPYGRVPTTYLVAEPKALGALVDHLKLKPVESGANVEILIPDEEQPFIDMRQPRSGLWTTSPLQTFLDLGAAGERGVEAADHLLEKHDLW